MNVHFPTGKINGYFDLTRGDTNADFNALLENAVSPIMDLRGKYIQVAFPVDSPFKILIPLLHCNVILLGGQRELFDRWGFFYKWGYLSPYDKVIDDYSTSHFLITQNQIDNVINEIKSKNYPALTDKMEYICDSNWEVFKNRLPLQPGTATKSGTNITMKGWQNVVAYEVYKDEKLMFVSNRSSFTLDSFLTDDTKVFAIAYNGDKTEVTF